MFGMKRKAAKAEPAVTKAPVSPKAPRILPEKLNEIVGLLETVGLCDPQDFVECAASPSSYFGGSLEWSERSYDMRFYVDGWPNGEVTRIWATPLRGATNSLYSNELISQVNSKIAAILAR